MNKSKEEKIVHDHLTHGISFRSLALKYGISSSRAHRIVKSNRSTYEEKPVQEELPDDVAMLKALLRKERLKNELLNNIIDIADKELGTNIRKKSGARRSE
jgi:antitoxin component HigA of HigAB toxin-antitoxin module